MVLVDFQIRDHINKGNIKVTPFDDSLINPNSLDLRLGGNFSTVEATYNYDSTNIVKTKINFNSSDFFDSFLNFKKYLDPLDKETFITKSYEGDVFYLEPNCMVIASLAEDITLPDFICARVVGKSSLGRLGLDNSSVAGWVDANWSGVLTIELFNHSQNIIKLTKGMKIGQMIFLETEPCEKGYDKTGRYYKQQPGQGSKGVS